VALALIAVSFAVLSQLRTGKLSLPSRRGNTVQNLVAIKRALQQYQADHNALPARIEDLRLSPQLLKDGAGRPFVYTNRYLEAGYAPGQGVFLIIGMTEPIGHFPLDPNKRSFAIIQTKGGEFGIHSSSDPEKLKP
jgi:type II secretory pathway pseudopilin PulG